MSQISSATKILVVEDEPAIRELIAVNLRHAGFTPILAAESIEAMRIVNASAPDLILLDWMLPGQSGIEFARQLRANVTTRAIPIVLLTARADEGDRLLGFDVGADDYITKPFSPREMIARIRAVVRRVAPKTDVAPFEIAGLKLDPQSYRVSAGQTAIKLGPTEFKLLQFFMKNPERVLSRDRLLSGVWGDQSYIEERTVDVHIRRLRLALEPSGHHQLLETVRGGGYRFALSLPH